MENKSSRSLIKGKPAHVNLYTT